MPDFVLRRYNRMINLYFETHACQLHCDPTARVLMATNHDEVFAARSSRRFVLYVGVVDFDCSAYAVFSLASTRLWLLLSMADFLSALGSFSDILLEWWRLLS